MSRGRKSGEETQGGSNDGKFDNKSVVVKKF